MSDHVARLLETLRRASPAILPSLLMCDFSRLREEIRRLEDAGAQALHLDVMDGRFTDNFTYGLTIVEAARRCTRLPLDTHLMMVEPEKYLRRFREAGADLITIHLEATPTPGPALEEIRASGAAAGLAFNPATPWESVAPHLPLCDAVLVMSVPAGFGGQPFDPRALDKLRALRNATGGRCLLEVDGGLNDDTTELAAAAGADLFVVGSSIFKHSDYAQRLSQLTARALCGRSSPPLGN